MSLKTHSLFYYGFVVSGDACVIDFKEGSSAPIFATLNLGGYSLTDFVTELSRAMTSAGTQTYTVTLNRATRRITISAASAFTLLIASGSHNGTSVFGVAGFTGSDTSSGLTHQGGAAGSSYQTQFILQSHIAPEDWQDSTYATVNKAASGKIEVVSYGQENFLQVEIKYATDINVGSGSQVRTNATGVEALRALMVYLITKGPLEFMADESDPDTFITVLLEQTPDDQKGLKYKLQEMYTVGLPGFFQTGLLLFRVIGDS